MAVAMGLGFAVPNANAIIEVESGGAGDALLFPLYIAKPGWENYYAITNNSAEWIQGHLRFRGAAWSAEVRDFDVILTPGDVFVFRVADIDGDGYGEIDMTIDPYNFMYTGMLEANNQWFDPEGQLRPYGKLTQGENTLTSRCRKGVDGAYLTDANFSPARQHYPCMDLDTKSLVDESISTYYRNGKGIAGRNGIEGFDQNHPGRRDHQKTVGYVEFVAEGVLEGMTHEVMRGLLASDSPRNLTMKYFQAQPRTYDQFVGDLTIQDMKPYQNGVFSGRGTNLWRWTDAANRYVADLGARDVPNVLSGTGFVSIVGASALSFNAEALINFRTTANEHRIENYRVYQDANGAWMVRLANGQTEAYTENNYDNVHSAVIIHHEDGASSAVGMSPYGDYVYADVTSEDPYERTISFNNTWGPTLADGDDYDLRAFGRPTTEIVGVLFDDFDLTTTSVTSVAEVEEAIRLAGQTYYSYYFDNGSPGSGVMNSKGNKAGQTTWYFAWYPTKFYYAERNTGFSMKDHFTSALDGLLAFSKGYGVEVWDINENPGRAVSVAANACPSPFVPSLHANLYPQCVGKDAQPQIIGLSEELTVFSIANLKATYGLGPDAALYSSQYASGRTVLSVLQNDPADGLGIGATFTFPYAGTGVQGQPSNRLPSYPGFMYGFEFDNSGNLYHWRSLQRSGSRAGLRKFCPNCF